MKTESEPPDTLEDFVRDKGAPYAMGDDTSNTQTGFTWRDTLHWFMCLLYVVYLLNHLANDTLGGITPIQACFGTTPDMSPLPQLHFMSQYTMRRWSLFQSQMKPLDTGLVLWKQGRPYNLLDPDG